MLSRFSIYNLDYINGAIIGEAYLTDCILVDQEFNEELKKINPIVYAKSNHTATYAWKLEKIKKYKHPIYMKGKLGLWNYEEWYNGTHNELSRMVIFVVISLN